MEKEQFFIKEMEATIHGLKFFLKYIDEDKPALFPEREYTIELIKYLENAIEAKKRMKKIKQLEELKRANKN